MAAAYSNADIVLFPSLYEGFGLPVIEGFKAGRAVITSNISPMKDVAKGAACLVDPKDIASIHEGVKLVINNRVYREELIEKAAEVVTSFSPEIIAERYLDIYEKIMECF
jgi:glycosyltransferase involved in cell wall biosynthesis